MAMIPALAALFAASEPALSDADTYSNGRSIGPTTAGEEARLDFWRKMWLPLAALLFAGSNNMIAFAVLFGIACFFFVIALFCAIAKVIPTGSTTATNWFTAWMQSYPSFAVQVISLPFLLCHLLPILLNISPYHLPLAVNGTSNATGSPEKIENIGDWQAVIVSAALTYTIFIYCLFTSRQKKCPIPWVYYVLMVCTAISLYVATGVEWVKIESLVVYFKTASLVALLCCAPHLYPGLTPRQSSCVVGFFVIFVLPLTMIVIRLQYDMTSIDSVIANVDEYKFWTGVIYLMFDFWEIYFIAANKVAEDMDKISEA